MFTAHSPATAVALTREQCLSLCPGAAANVRMGPVFESMDRSLNGQLIPVLFALNALLLMDKYYSLRQRVGSWLAPAGLSRTVVYVLLTAGVGGIGSMRFIQSHPLWRVWNRGRDVIDVALQVIEGRAEAPTAAAGV